MCATGKPAQNLQSELSNVHICRYNNMSIEMEIFFAIGGMTAVAMLGGAWMMLRRSSGAHKRTLGGRSKPVLISPVALALHRETLEKQIGLTTPRVQLVQQVAETRIENGDRRLEWAEFDREFISACMKSLGGTLTCMSESFRRFVMKDERLLVLSQQIYSECLRQTKDTKDHDGRILRNIIAAYADARKLHR